MKSNRIWHVSVLAALLLLSVAGAPMPRAAQAGHDPNVPQNGITLVAGKTVSQAQANWGDMLVYTITLTNTSVLSPVATLMTDTLPLSLAFQPQSLTASGGTVTHTAQVIKWSGVITPNGVITISLQAKAIRPSTIITNVAVADTGIHGLYRTPVVTTTVGLAHIYLPFVIRPVPGIAGLVTFQGSPAAGVPLLLRLFDGAQWSTAATLSTAGDGSYRFNPPALAPGQKYYVLFRNNTDPTRLSAWATRELTAFQPSDTVDLGVFDTANIELNSPAAGSGVGLPFSFQWTPRASTPTDSYEFNLTDYNTGNPFFYTDPPLGYVGNYVLAKLPPGFKTNTGYVWFMWAYDTNGGYGQSYWAYGVGFTNAGAAPSSALSLSRIPTANLPEGLIERK